MRTRISIETVRGPFATAVEEISGQNLLSCNQCGKCSAGCPVVSVMQVLPSQVIRLAQLGLGDRLAPGSPTHATVWLCASCLACSTRCPKGVDLPRVMEAVRQTVLRRGERRIEVSDLPDEVLRALPQVAIVGAYRKFVG